jgi:hypothetical protein
MPASRRIRERRKESGFFTEGSEGNEGDWTAFQRTVNAPTEIGQTVTRPTHTHNTNFSTGTNDTKPLYYDVVWIMRIK